MKHILGTKNGQTLLCDCPVSCTCDAAGVKDDKCACGKEVKTMVKHDGHSCGCPETPAKPSKCGCSATPKACK